jgi:hypothetical protein
VAPGTEVGVMIDGCLVYDIFDRLVAVVGQRTAPD